VRGRPAKASGAVRAEMMGEKVEKKRLNPSSEDWRGFGCSLNSEDSSRMVCDA